MEKIKISIRTKLLLTIGGPLLIIYLLVLGTEYQHLRTYAYDYTEVYLTELASNYAAVFDQEFAKVSQVVRSMASFISIHSDLKEEELYKQLQANLREDPLIYGSCIAFEPYAFKAEKKSFAPYVWRTIPKQADLSSMDLATGAYNYFESGWYKPVKTRMAPFWSEPYFEKNAGNTLMSTFVAPFYLHDKFAGVATIDIRLEDLQKELPLSKGKELFSIFTQDGRFISHPNPQAIMKETIYSLGQKRGISNWSELGKKMLSGQKGAVLFPRFINNNNFFIAYAPIPSSNWIFSVAISETEIMAPVWKRLAAFSYTMLAGLLMIFCILFIASIRITNPIRHLAHTIREISKGNLEAKAKYHFERDEIGELGYGINKMAGDLKAHIEALTHEIQARQAVESELDVARNIQKSLLPMVFPPYPDRKEFSLSAINHPAHHVAGDFFDFTLISENTLMFLIADVSGKGIPAALFMAVTRTLIRNFATTGISPAAVLGQTNLVLTGSNDNGLFVTVFLGYFDVKTGRLLYANAGHPQPYLIKTDGTLQKFGSQTGTVLGAFKTEGFQEEETSLQLGETLLLFTDGFTEARNKEGAFWGPENFEALIKSISQESTDIICGNVFQAVSDFQKGDFADDATILALRRNKLI